MLLFNSKKGQSTGQRAVVGLQIAQSTAEYAIVLGLVVAVVAGVLQTTLKGGIRQKNKEALGYLLNAGNDILGNYSSASEKLYSQTYQKTIVSKSEDTKVMSKGGGEKSNQTQISSTSAVNVELLNATQ